MTRSKMVLWSILAILFLCLAYVNWVGYSEIKEKVGGIYAGKNTIIVADPSELNETEKAMYVDLSYVFQNSALINAIGFVLAAFAAVLSAKW